MLRFCFPERDPENIEGDGIDDTDSIAGSTTSLSKKSKTSERTVKKNKDSNFYVPIEQKDDVEKMKVIMIVPLFGFRGFHKQLTGS